MSLNQNKIYYRQRYTLEQRREEFERVRELYPHKIFIILERIQNSDIPQIKQKKFIVPPDLTVSKFVYVIRRHCQLNPQKALFIFVENILPPNSALMSKIHYEHADPDGFLYLTYSGENTFG